MRKETNRTVRLSDYEDDAYKHFEFLLDEGHNIPDAVLDTKREYPKLTDEFVDWLGS